MKPVSRLKAQLFGCAVIPLIALASAAQGAEATEKNRGTEISEIVVTATRQEQSLSKVAISATAFTQETLDNKSVKSIDDLTRLSPGVNLTRNGFGTQASISIRGISSDIGAGTTGIYIDDTPIQTRSVGYSSTNAYPQLFDLARVEVLRGPQGTLFGAGSQGGTVRFITPDPSLTDFSTYGRAEVAATKSGSPSADIGVATGGPIIADKLGFRVSASVRHEGGFIDRIDWQTGKVIDKDSNSQDAVVMRGALTWAPTENLRISPSVIYQDVKLNDTYAFWDTISDPSENVYKQGQSLPQTDKDNFVLPALKINYDMGAVEFVSNTSYFTRITHAIDDYTTLSAGLFADDTHIPGFPEYVSYAYMENKQNVFTQEVRLQSTDTESRLTWVAGVFYSDAVQKYVEHIVDPQFEQLSQLLFGVPLEIAFGQSLIGPDSLIAYGRVRDKQLAAFGDVNFQLTDKLKLTAGLRLSKATVQFSDFGTGPFAGGTTAASGKASEKPVTPKFGATYQFDSGNMLYFTAAKGFRVGGANPHIPASRCGTDFANLGIAGAPDTYESDSLWSYELGSKNRLLDNRMQIAASVYRIDWKNIQQNRYLPRCAMQFTDNLGTARSEGFDLQVQYNPVAGLMLEGSLAYTNARYTKPVYGPFDPNLGRDRIIINENNHLISRPWSGTLAAEYNFTSWGDRDSYVRADYEYRGGSALTAARDSMTTSFDPASPDPEPTHNLKVRAGVKLDAVDISVFATNILNNHPTLTRYAEGGDPVRRVTTLNPPTVGLTLTTRF